MLAALPTSLQHAFNHIPSSIRLGFDFGLPPIAQATPTYIAPNKTSLSDEDRASIMALVAEEQDKGRISAWLDPPDACRLVHSPVIRASKLGVASKANGKKRLVTDFSDPHPPKLPPAVNEYLVSKNFPCRWPTFAEVRAGRPTLVSRP